MQIFLRSSYKCETQDMKIQVSPIDVVIKTDRIDIFKKIYLFYLFIFGYVGSPLLHVGPLQPWRAGAALRCGARASHRGGFSCCGAQALGAWASVAVAHGLSSGGSQSQ